MYVRVASVHLGKDKHLLSTHHGRLTYNEKQNLEELHRKTESSEKYEQIRDFAATFEPLGLRPSYAGTAYGLAEHVVGVCEHEANLEGRPLSELSDADLECVGEVSRLSEGSQVRTDGLRVECRSEGLMEARRCAP